MNEPATYQTARDIITKNADKLELIARSLLEYETLDASHLRDLIDHGVMSNPPTMPKPPPVPEELRKKPAKKPAEENQPEDHGPIPGVVGAPA